MKKPDDPIFAAIETHRAAAQAWDAHKNARPSRDDEQYAQWERGNHALHDETNRSRRIVVVTTPTTVDGCLAKLRTLVNEDDPLDVPDLPNALLKCAAVLYAENR
jgi:hypothetical protein